MKPTTYTYLSLLLIIALISACSTTKKSSKPASSSVEEDMDLSQPEETTDLQALLNNNRSSLSDLYLTQQQDMPDVFSNENVSKGDQNSDPYNGYRIQILSARKVSKADSAATLFRKWSQKKIKGYNPKAYVSFKQPYYKLKVGDFHERDQANHFSKLLKTKYSGAWVVHDRIKPSNIPADTTDITIDESPDDDISIH